MFNKINTELITSFEIFKDGLFRTGIKRRLKKAGVFQIMRNCVVKILANDQKAFRVTKDYKMILCYYKLVIAQDIIISRDV